MKPTDSLQQNRENVRRAARRAVLVQIAGQIGAAMAGAQVDPDILRRHLEMLGRTMPELIVDHAESLLAEIESRYGADW